MKPRRACAQRLAIVVAGLCAGLSASGHAESPQGALPPDAQQAFDRGVAAVKQEAWDLAARYFEEAQKAAPVAPAVLFNLGLAHAKAGHELAGTAWLRAYLAAAPSAGNAAVVQAEIDRLKAATRAKMAKIFQGAIEVAQQLPEEWDRKIALLGVSRSQALAGDLEGARATIRLADPADQDDASVQELYGKALAEAGDVEGARQVVTRLTDPGDDQDAIWGPISDTLRRQGDLLGAWKAAKQIQSTSTRSWALRLTAEAKIDEGDFVPAEEVIPLLENPSDRSHLLRDIVWKQMKAGNLDGARRTTERMPDVQYKLRTWCELAMTEAESGDMDAANAIAKDVLAFAERNPTVQEMSVSVAHALLGDDDAAMALVEGCKDYNVYYLTELDEAYGRLAFLRARAGDMNGAKRLAKRAAEHLAKLPEDQIQSNVGAVAARIAQAQVLQGDVAGALQTVLGNKEKWVPFDRAMTAIVEAQLAAGDITQAMETARAMEWWRKGDRSGVDGALSLIAKAQMKTGDLAGAERTVASLLVWEQKLDACLALADAYHQARADDAARRILAEVAETIGSHAEPPVVFSVSGAVEQLGTLSKLFQRIAEAQARLGDQRGVKDTRARLALAQWVAVANILSRDEAVVRIEAALKERSAKDILGRDIGTGDVPDRIAGLGAELGAYLLLIQTMERQSAG